MRSRKPVVGSAGAAALAAVLTMAGTGGCADEPAVPDAPTGEVGDDGSLRLTGGGTTVSRHLTTVAFASPDTAVALLLRLETEAGSGRLERRYRGWLGRSAVWQPVLSLDDTLSLPGAGGRLLPGGGLRLRVVPEEEVAAYRIVGDGRELSLDVGEALSGRDELAGADERLRRARLRVGEDTLPGVALVRRVGSPASDDEGRARGGGFLLLALSDDGGLAAALPPGRSGTVSAHGRFGPREGRRDSVLVVLPGDDGGGAVRLPGGGFALGLEALGGPNEGPAVALRARSLDGSGRTGRGLLVGPRER